MELPGVPDTPEWMCPLCEVDQLSADEDLYPDSEPEELQYILFDDTYDATEIDNEVRKKIFISMIIIKLYFVLYSLSILLQLSDNQEYDKQHV